MEGWFRSLKVPTAIMLILATSALFVLPPKMHIVLCLGSDGHLDIVEKACLSDCIPSHGHKGDTFSGENHNLNCQDILLGCSSCEQIASQEGNNNICKINANKDLPLVTGLAVGDLLPRSDYQKPLTFNFQFLSAEPQHLAFLETTVIVV